METTWRIADGEEYQTRDVLMTARARFFSGGPLETRRVLVEPDGTILVDDPVAGHYTRCHSLAPAAQRRIRRQALAWRADQQTDR